MYNKLAERVTFDVLQDTDEEDVWNKLEGGKDDVYIYDRCGRLAFYIPYPLSVMTTSDSLVPKAIVTTYYLSPCGNSCGPNTTFTEGSYNETIETTTQVNLVTSLFQDEKLTDTNNLNSSETYNQNNTMNGTQGFDSKNDTNFKNTSNDLSHMNDILSIIHNSTDNTTTDEFNSIQVSNVDELSSNDSNSIINHNHSRSMNHSHDLTVEQNHHSHHTSIQNDRSEREVPKSDRCREADVEVCKDFTKKQLLRIQTCCLLSNNQRTRSCKKFTPRKCKKMKTIIKCCLKTLLKDDELDTETTLIESTTSSIIESTTLLESTTITSIICCKDTSEGKVCRTSGTGVCENDGEYEEVDRNTEEVNLNTGENRSNSL